MYATYTGAWMQSYFQVNTWLVLVLGGETVTGLFRPFKCEFHGWSHVKSLAT